MHMCGYVRLNLLPREELLNGQVGAGPDLSPSGRGRIIPGASGGVSRDRESKNLSNVARGCGAVRGHLDLHWMGHSCDVRGGTLSKYRRAFLVWLTVVPAICGTVVVIRYSCESCCANEYVYYVR